MSNSRSFRPDHSSLGIARPLLVRFQQQITAKTIDRGTTIAFGDFKFAAGAVLREMDKDAFRDQFDEWHSRTWKPAQSRIVEKIHECYSPNHDRFRSLASAVKANRVMPFVGSGMSVPSGYPMWKKFLCSMRELSNLSEPEFDTKLAASYEDAAEAVCEAMPPPLWKERFLASFAPKKTTGAGPVQWLPPLFPDFALTTNYDPVLESVYHISDAAFESSLSGTDIQYFRQHSGAGKRCIIKLHGDYERNGTWVLTKSDYDRAYAPSSPALAELERIFTNMRVLFLGCSLAQDKTMDVLKSLAARDSQIPDHYALLQMPGDNKERLAREHFLAERKIFPIWYTLDDHDAALEALLGALAAESGRI